MQQGAGSMLHSRCLGQLHLSLLATSFTIQATLAFSFCIRILFMTPGLTLPFDSFMTCLHMRSTQNQ